MELKIEYLPVDSLKPYEKNARKHEKVDVDAIAASIKEFGFDDPIGVWGDENLIVEGHGRLLAAKQLGMKTVPVIRLDHLTDEQRRAYALAHNRTAELSLWDRGNLEKELREIGEIDMRMFSFRLPDNDGSDFFENRERFDMSREEANEEYNEFLEKFEEKKTTDDCYTPDNIYDVVAQYVEEKYGRNRADFIRPFYPGGNYQKENYDGKTVVDNPPFSIMSEIVDFYIDHDISFFLFCPFSSAMGYSRRPEVCAICLQASVMYENGAIVQTSFLTNMEDPSICAFGDPDFYQRIKKENDVNMKKIRKSLQKYEYPDNVITSARLGYLTVYGQRLIIKRESAYFIRELDAQKESGKGIFGSGYLLSEKAAAEKAAAEKAAAEKTAVEKFTLSDREWAIVKNLK